MLMQPTDMKTATYSIVTQLLTAPWGTAPTWGAWLANDGPVSTQCIASKKDQARYSTHFISRSRTTDNGSNMKDETAPDGACRDGSPDSGPARVLQALVSGLVGGRANGRVSALMSSPARALRVGAMAAPAAASCRPLSTCANGLVGSWSAGPAGSCPLAEREDAMSCCEDQFCFVVFVTFGM